MTSASKSVAGTRRTDPARSAHIGANNTNDGSTAGHAGGRTFDDAGRIKFFATTDHGYYEQYYTDAAA
jgi:hypothetical protein